MSTPSPAIIPLFPPERVITHLVVTDYGRPSQAEHTVTLVTGRDGVQRQVERSRRMTVAQAEAQLRMGAAAVWL